MLRDLAAANGHADAPAEPSAFVTIIKPLVDAAYGRLLEHLEELHGAHPAAPVEPQALAPLLFARSSHRLDWILSRTVVFEMAVARLRGELTGDDARERFRRFIDELREPRRLLGLLQEYPVLARIVSESLDTWSAEAREFSTRLAIDWHLLRERFFAGEDPGELVRLGGGLGDRHRAGRAVRSLEFRSGARLVYKPRSLRIEERFRGLLDQLNAWGAPELWTPDVLDRGTHGWCAFVQPRQCAGEEEVRLFYQRLGAYIALFYALCAHDFHRENLIAHGAWPVPVDLETLLGPDFGRGSRSHHDSLASYVLANSVHRTMLLPYLHESRPGEGFEPSGLGGRDDQFTIVEMPVWEAKETDGMRLGRQRLPVGRSLNRPRCDGREVDPRRYRGEVVEGFEQMYRLLVNHREELMESLPTSFGDCEIRVLFRDTELYSLVLRNSFHPDLMRDALDRDRFFDRLWFGMDFLKLHPVLLRTLPHEIADLWRGDIPYFWTTGSSRDVTASDSSRIQGLLVRSGIERARDQLATLGEDDLRVQLGFLEASFAALAMTEDRELPRYPAPRRLPQEVGEDRLLAEAGAAADRLAALALSDQEGTSWIGLAPLRQGWQQRPLGMDLYSGLPGVIFALAHLGEHLERQDFRQLAEGAFRTLRRRLKLHGKYLRILGGFMGWGGLLYLWIHLATLWKRSDLLEEAVQMLDALDSRVDEDVSYDLVFGAAGCIPPLLHLHRLHGTPRALDLAIRMGDHLLASAQCPQDGFAWMTIDPEQPQTGFSHGGSGIAWSLARLSAATGMPRFLDACRRALLYENRFFDQKSGNWMDLRGWSPEKPRRFMAAWCNGAGGIALCRQQVAEQLRDDFVGFDLAAAGEVVRSHGFGSNHSLCHGDLGSLDILLGLPGSEEAVSLRKRQVVASIAEHGWRAGVPRVVETPGLLEGLAGIAYGLLRLARPRSIPSVLSLDPPQ